MVLNQQPADSGIPNLYSNFSHSQQRIEINKMEFLYLVLCFFCLTFAQDIKELRYSIPEGTESGYKIGNIYQDANLDQIEQNENSTNTYYYGSYVEDKFAPYFEVDRDEGLLLSKEQIDREVLCPGARLCQFSLDVRVTEEEDNQIIVAYCKVFVVITDVNDNAPTFPESVFYLPISEASIPDTKFSLHVAEDLDSPPFGIQKYDLLKSDSDLFDLEVVKDLERDIDVRLLLLNRLDRETKESYSVTVRAIDGGSPPQTGTLHVNITVVDMNDNNPKFTKPLYIFNVAENVDVGSAIAEVSASDADSGENGRITYKLDCVRNKNSTFDIDSTTGKIKIVRKLDYEETTVHLLTVIAEDHGSSPLKDTTKVKIKVTDKNDNKPMIRLRAFNNYAQIAIYENQEPQKVVANALVTDADSGRNGKFACRLVHGDFTLRELYKREYQILSKKRFDREIQSSYNITIQCQDFGIPRLSSSKLVRVQISDQNDNAPVFSQSHYKGILHENNIVGASILRVTAEDRDEGPNRYLSYYLNGEINELLHIDVSTGLISAKAVFDYEQRPEYQFNVTARDHGHPPRASTVPVVLRVVDVNDLAPKFKLSKYAFGVTENQEKGTKVGIVSAVDLDLPPFNKFTYSLDRNVKGARAFEIDKDSGTIITRKKLDRELQSSYHLRVTAKDTGNPPLTGTAGVIVYVGDVNDNKPMIEFPNHANDTSPLSGQTPEDHVVYTVKARDIDVGNNAKLSYALRGDRHKDIFYIEEWSGKIKVKKIPESSSRLRDRHVFNLAIVVTDFGQPPQSATATLKLVIDPNLPYVPRESPKTILRKRNLIILICVTSLATIIIITLLVVLLCLRTRSLPR